MKLSYRWLSQLVDLHDIDPADVALRLTMATAEIEEVSGIGDDLEGVVIGRITEVSAHPDSDHLFLTKIDVGKEVLDIVSGAPNTKKGALVPVALVGSRLPGGTVVRKAKLRGADSYGIVCSEKEAGASDDHTGLWILDDEGEDQSLLVPGTPLHRQWEAGEFQLLEPEAMLVELRQVIQNLDGLTRCVFRTNHASNYLPLRGTLPEDRDRLLESLDGAIDQGREALRPEYWRGL